MNRLLAFGACFGLLSTATSATTANAQEFVLNAEASAAIWVDDPQATRFTPGFYGAVRPGVALGRYVALQLSYAIVHTPAADGFEDSGTAHFLMGGLRVRPLAALAPDHKRLDGLFIDTNLGYVRTGSLDRFGFDVGLGYNFQVAPSFALGPVARYVQIVQSDDVINIDDGDAQLFTVGLNLAFGPSHEPPAEPIVDSTTDRTERVTTETVVVETTTTTPPDSPLMCPCPDRDGDTVCDVGDECPDVFGPADSVGCPLDPCTGARLSVLVQFNQDSAGLPRLQSEGPQTMTPVLDAVAAAIARDPSCRVCVVGYASDEGDDAHNQTLSEGRATAVRGYLSARGIEEARVPTTGFGSRCQIAPESTRVLNRRVRFIRLSEGESCPTECAPNR